MTPSSSIGIRRGLSVVLWFAKRWPVPTAWQSWVAWYAMGAKVKIDPLPLIHELMAKGLDRNVFRAWTFDHLVDSGTPCPPRSQFCFPETGVAPAVPRLGRACPRGREP